LEPFGALVTLVIENALALVATSNVSKSAAANDSAERPGTFLMCTPLLKCLQREPSGVMPAP
jgi:hypothetical protein